MSPRTWDSVVRAEATTLKKLFVLPLTMVLLAFVAPGTSKAEPTQTLPGSSVYQLKAKFVDESGKRTTFPQMKGYVRVVGMFYTSCKFICPLIVDSGLAIDKQLSADEKKRLGITLISMDTARDMPPALMAVAKRRKLDLTRWNLVTPAEEDLPAFAGILGVKYRKLSDGEFNHTSALILLDQEGRELARTEQMGSVTDPVFMKAIHSALARK